MITSMISIFKYITLGIARCRLPSSSTRERKALSPFTWPRPRPWSQVLGPGACVMHLKQNQINFCQTSLCRHCSTPSTIIRAWTKKKLKVLLRWFAFDIFSFFSLLFKLGPHFLGRSACTASIVAVLSVSFQRISIRLASDTYLLRSGFFSLCCNF